MASAALRPEAAAEQARQEVDAYFEALQRKSLLRFITCGSVDDGKSTLVGRLLFDAKLLLEDQLEALERDSKAGGELDLALLVDGLAAEREQGITIDVAYRFFATEKRKFIIADTPGHEQYTRNMATGASTADLAVILIDARKGLLPQSRRHSFLVHLLGIRQVVLAVNKMDLAGFAQARFDEIVADYRALAGEIGIADFTAIPISARSGDNVASRSAAMPWYEGPSLLEHLETVPVQRTADAIAPFRMPVQWVNRPGQDFRGYSGTVASGRVRKGDSVAIIPSGRTTSVTNILVADRELDEAHAGQAVTLTFADAIDCSRGDVVASGGAAALTDALDASLVWMSESPLAPDRSYWLKLGARTATARVTVDRVLAEDGSGGRPGTSLALNEIGRVRVLLDRRIAATTYEDSRSLGGFILIDKATNSTIAAGLVDGLPSGKAARGQVERIFWAADQVRAEAMRARFGELGRAAFILTEAALREELDGEPLPDGHVSMTRRAAGVARLMAAAGVTVIVAISPAAGAEVPGSTADLDPGDGMLDEDWVI